jgi:hypothetical protein
LRAFLTQLIACLVSLLLVACAAVPPSQPPAAPLAVSLGASQPLVVPAGYVVVWSDEFSSDGLPDPKRWD